MSVARSCRGALVLMVAAACAPKGPVAVTPPEPPSSAAPPSTASPPVDAGLVDAASHAPPQASPEMEALLAERDHLEDPAITFGRLAQTPPPHRYAVPALGAFPVRSVARVVLYTFGRAPRTAGCVDPDDLRTPFTMQGTLCPDVVAPGVVLDDAEATSITSLVTTAEQALAEAKKSGHWARRAVTRCGFDPHHAVGFYDARGNVVARMLVCFSCGEWIVSPGSDATGGSSPSVMSAEQATTLRERFDARGLGAWVYRERGERLAEYEGAVYGSAKEPTEAGRARRARRLAPGSGAPASSPLRDLAVEGRRKLCDWAAYEVEPTGERSRDRGYACPDGRQWRSDPVDPSCATAKTTCARTVAEIEACLRVFHEPDDLCAAAPPPPCAGVLECLPGLSLLGTEPRDAGR